MATSRILIVRLGAMGDIIHTLPAAAALKAGHPQSQVTWVVEPQWAPLIEENPFVDRVLRFRRERFFESLRELRAERYDFAVDFQGLVKSAVVARLAGPRRIFGFAGDIARERAASLFYSNRVTTTEVHMVDMRLDLAAAAGARKAAPVFPLPAGRAEGDLPAELDPQDLARYLAAVLNGLGIQAANGATKAEMTRVVEMALRTLPKRK